MVDVSLTFVTTIIVVTMTTLFFCCWRKKGSRDIVAGKSGSTKEELKSENSVSPTSASVERSENGVQTQSRTPTLLVTSGEDVGDFSDVQRETEILRSYRKPAPPKNRARQSRAPRQLQPETQSRDIFSELSEEDAKNEKGSTCSKENVGSCDDVDSAQLRSHSEDRTIRDVRSSMLADIEQTLATLHVSEQATVVLSGEDSLSDDKTSLTDFVVKITSDVQDEHSASQGKSEPLTDNLKIHENKSSHLQMPFSIEVVSKSLTASPKANDGKTGPKVSPKPSPRTSARVSSLDNNTASVEADKHIHTREIGSLSSNPTVDNVRSIEPTASSLQCPSLQAEVETTDMGMIEETSGLQTIQKSTFETMTQNIHSQTTFDNTESGVLSIPVDTTKTIRDEIQSEDTLDSSNCDKSETAAKISENPFIDLGNDEDPLTEPKSITANSIKEAGDSGPTFQTQSESKTLVSTGIEIADGLCGNTLQEFVPQSPTIESKALAAEREAASVQAQDDNTGRSKENGTQRKESIEDQTGKGKSSKIPVRSGSKPRSSPPKLEKNGERAPSTSL